MGRLARITAGAYASSKVALLATLLPACIPIQWACVYRSCGTHTGVAAVLRRDAEKACQSVQVTTPDDMSVAERFLEEATAAARAASSPGACSNWQLAGLPPAPLACVLCGYTALLAAAALLHGCAVCAQTLRRTPAHWSSASRCCPLRTSWFAVSGLLCADPLEDARVQDCEANPSQPECRVYDD